MKTVRSSVLLIILLLTSSFYCKSQNNNPNDYLWNLSSLYNDSIDWSEDYRMLESKISELMTKSNPNWSKASEFVNSMEELSAIMATSAKVALYGVLAYEEFAHKKPMMDKGMDLYSRVNASIAPINYSIRLLEQQQLSQWIKSTPAIEKYLPLITHVRNARQHTLSPEAEAVMTRSTRWTEMNADLFNKLHETHGKETYFMDGSEDVSLSRSFFRSNMANTNRGRREKIAKEYFNSLTNYQDVFAQLYNNKIEAELIRGKLRNYDDGISATWNLMDGLPEGSHLKLVSFVRNNLSTLHRYANMRKEILGVDTLKILDFNTQAKEILDRKYSFSEAIEIALSTAEVFGSDFQKRMKDALQEGKQFHFADTDGKTVRYHIHPPVAGSYAYYGFQFRPDHIRARALVGGLYGTIFDGYMDGKHALNVLEGPVHIYGNGTIYIGDILYDEGLLKKLDKQGQIAYKLNQLEFFKRVFKWSIFIELESYIQSKIIDNTPLNGEQISQKYLELVKEYYGHEAGITQVDDYIKHDWMTESAVPFMSGYQHHAWPVAISVATLVIEKSMQSKMKGTPLKLDYSNGYDSYHIFLANRIDLASDEHFKALIRKMEAIMDELETLMN